jgi:hypothetical protein
MDQQESAAEQDPRFPSGPWLGFYLQYWLPGRHPTRVHLAWQKGRLEGRGRDEVGTYTVEGSYDLGTGRCEWTKQYLGRHAVIYRGVAAGAGVWGVWELRQLGGLFTDRGGFHIWPEGVDVTEDSARTEQAVKEMMRQEFGRPLFRAIRWLSLFAALALAALVVYWRWQF